MDDAEILKSIQCKKALMQLVFAPIVTGHPFHNGYGGIHRPIGDEVPQHLQAMIRAGLVNLTTGKAPSPDGNRREQWQYILTEKGRVYAKLVIGLQKPSTKV